MVIASGISVYGISKENIKNIRTVIPPINEQRKIASILSAWDKAIELKEKLIELKKLQKKGLMQKLLTGEVRLPGFDKEWGKFKIKKVCNVVSGGTPSTNDKRYWDGNIPWCTPTDITSSGKFICNTKQTITEEGLKNSSANLLPKNSILMCSRATIGPRSINKVEMATNQGFKSFVCNKEYLDYEFFYYLLSLYIPIFKKLASGSTFLEVSKKDVENTSIFIPKDVKEQKAIGSIFSNLDKAIELLEKEIKELKQQKKGLMQLLLTGKVRVKV
jgi:type I restriction enzyme S subunit